MINPDRFGPANRHRSINHFTRENTMTAPIAIQLYTVRDLLVTDYDRVIERLAAMGYAGVEYLTLPAKSAREASRLFQSHGLDVPSAHLPLPLGDMQGEVLE